MMRDVDVAFITRADGAVLLQLRRADRALFPLMWECPGGKREDGESAVVCVLRELWEELRINPREAVVRGPVFSREFEDFSCRVNFHEVGLLPSLPHDTLLLKDALAVGWFAPAALPHLILTPGNKAFFQHLGWCP